MSSDDITDIKVLIAEITVRLDGLQEKYQELNNILQNYQQITTDQSKVIQDYYYVYDTSKKLIEGKIETLEGIIEDLKVDLKETESDIKKVDETNKKSVFKRLMNEISDSKVLQIIKIILTVILMVLGADKIRVIIGSIW